MAQTSAAPVSLTIEAAPADKSTGDALLFYGGLMLTAGAFVAVAWLYGPLPGIAAALVVAGLLTFLVGILASKAGK